MTKPKLIRQPKGLPAGFRERRQHRNAEWVIEKYVSVTVDPWGVSVGDYVQQLHEASAGLIDSSVDLDVEYGSYGDRDRDHVIVTGWRPATQDEIDAARRERVEAEQQQREWQDRQIEALKQSRPEVFK